MKYFTHNNKKVFYSQKGSGEPLIIIHGNSVSGKMHVFLKRKLAKHFQVISLDLPGHGRSDRLQEWPVDFWFEHGKTIKALIDHLELKKVILLGYSGGAQIALNTALQFPESVGLVVADSFEGGQSVASFAENIYSDRENDKKKIMAKIFWFLMHGRDWKDVVDQDSKVIHEHHKTIGSFFHKKLSELQVPVLLTGSLEDEYIHNIDTVYEPIVQEIPDAEIKIYDKGKHPACLTAGAQYVKDITNLINEKPKLL